MAARSPASTVRARRAPLLVTALAFALVAASCDASVQAANGTDQGPTATVTPPSGPAPVGPRTGPPTSPPTSTTTTTTLRPGAPSTTVTFPSEGSNVAAPVTLTGTAAARDRVGRVTVTVKDTSNGTYWNPATGTWQSAWLWTDATVTSTTTPTTTWSTTFDPSGTTTSGLYQVKAFAWDGTGTIDPVGVVSTFAVRPDEPRDWQLVWGDEFDGAGLDAGHWKAVTGGYGTPYRDQQYTSRSSNVRVENGNLVLEAHTEPSGDQGHTSGMVVSNDAARPSNGATRGNTAWTYGRFEVRARVPDISGMWPAFWLRPADSAYGAWPRSGEIDVLEYAGPTPRGAVHPWGRFFAAALHTWDPDGGDGTDGGPDGSKKHEGIHRVDAAFVDEFHTWAVEWSPGEFRWYVDGRLFHVADRDWLAPGAAFPAPFDQPFFITLNLQVGGYAGPADDASLPARFEIDHVRVYQ